MFAVPQIAASSGGTKVYYIELHLLKHAILHKTRGVGGGGSAATRSFYHGRKSQPSLSRNWGPTSLNLDEVLASVTSSSNHCLKLGGALGPRTGLQTAVRVNPKQLGVEDLAHFLDAVSHLLSRRDTRRVDVENTGTDLVGILGLLEDLQQLRVALAVLDRDHVGVQRNDRVHDIVEVRVTEVASSVHAI